MDAGGIALVTGASRGLGRAVALELAARGFDVVASMRDPSAGRDLAAPDGASGSLEVARLDVNDPSTIDVPRGTRVVVNNAGVEGEYLPIEHADLAQWRHMLETNVIGLVEVTKRAIPVLRDAGGGVICNVGSSSILAPVPFYAAYRASKAAVSAIGESLRAEVAPFGIRVLEIMPGPIETDMLRDSERMPEAHRFPEYRTMAERSYEQRKGVVPMYTPAADAARAIADAILDDSAPLRVGCDPLSVGMLEGWRAQPDEDWMRSMLGALD
jgi:NAD(P)-dependent dehydrogenase (short-subunit alcohol dehydrogenase family)